MRFLWQKHRMPSINSTAPNKMISIKTAEQTLPLIYAPVTELVDMRDLGSRAVMRVGSSPTTGTIRKSPVTATVTGFFLSFQEIAGDFARSIRGRPGQNPGQFPARRESKC